MASTHSSQAFRKTLAFLILSIGAIIAVGSGFASAGRQAQALSGLTLVALGTVFYFRAKRESKEPPQPTR